MTKGTTRTDRWATLAFGIFVGFCFLLPPDRSGAGQEGEFAVSPALKIAPTLDRATKDYSLAQPQSVRSMDGSGNNLDDPAMGTAYTPLLRRVPPNRQRDLFESEAPPPTLPLERRAKLLALLQALLMETLSSDATVVQEGGHDQDHA